MPYEVVVHNELRVGMAIFGRLPLWWDRDSDDETGKPLRPDVREAGHRVWNSVCLKAQHVLGDANDAPELLERSVRAISRYLDKQNVLPYSNDPSGLLILACHRSLCRIASRRSRIALVGDGSMLAELLRAPDWLKEMDRHLFLEALARQLNNESRLILRLRIMGYDWREIGRMLGIKPPAASQRLWREMRRAHLALVSNTNPKSSTNRNEQA